jgi:hypothetical protein|tara:strand:- start:3616 stop:3942 length:327 start_codon:yes stop_codon:yes gene_type:complete
VAAGVYAVEAVLTGGASGVAEDDRVGNGHRAEDVENATSASGGVARERAVRYGRCGAAAGVVQPAAAVLYETGVDILGDFNISDVPSGCYDLTVTLESMEVIVKGIEV